MPALLYGPEVWGKIGKDDMNKIKKINRRKLKRMFNLPRHMSENKQCGKHEQIQWKKAGER